MPPGEVRYVYRAPSAAKARTDTDGALGMSHPTTIIPVLIDAEPARGRFLTNLAAMWGIKRRWFESDKSLRGRVLAVVFSTP